MLELARPHDRDAVNTLANQIHELHVSWRPDIYESVAQRYPADRFSEVVQRRELYVAKVGGIVAGYVLLKTRLYDMPGLVRRKVMIIEEFCVEEALRRQGIGTEMMGDVRALARAFGCTDLQLGVYPENDGAVTFYQKCGFRIRSIDMQMKL